MALLRNLVLTLRGPNAVLDVGIVIAIIVYALIGWVLARLIAIVFPQRDGFRKAAREASAGHVHPDERR